MNAPPGGAAGCAPLAGGVAGCPVAGVEAARGAGMFAVGTDTAGGAPGDRVPACTALGPAGKVEQSSLLKKNKSAGIQRGGGHG